MFDRRSTDYLLIPRVQASASHPSLFTGAFETSMVGETPTQADDDVAFETAAIGVRKLKARARISNDVLADAPYAMGQLSVLAGQDLAAKLNKQFLVGAGDGLSFLGAPNTPGLATRTPMKVRTVRLYPRLSPEELKACLRRFGTI